MSSSLLLKTQTRTLARSPRSLLPIPSAFAHLKLKRSFQNKPITKTNTSTQASTFASHNDNQPPVPTQPKENEYLNTLNKKELFSYGIIGLATINKYILDIIIKAFPYIPMFLVKLLVYRNYCGGENVEEVKRTGLRLSERGIKNMMISLTIEGCNGKDIKDSQYILDETNKSVNEILFPHTLTMIEKTIFESGDINDVPPGYVAIKPSALIEDAANVLTYYNDHETDYPVKFGKMVDNCSSIVENVYKRNVELSGKYPTRIAPFVIAVIDAEKFDLQRGVYELQRILYKKYNPLHKPVSVVGTVQMYLKESGELLKSERKLAEDQKYRLGLKLVRGAYIHSEPRRNVIHDTKIDTDINYDAGIKSTLQNILSSSNENDSTIGHLVVASHNGESQLEATKLLAKSNNKQKSNIVLGQLLGMADNVTHELISRYNVSNIIKYVPWGPPLETKEYLQRRMEENGDAVRADNGLPLVKGVIQAFSNKL